MQINEATLVLFVFFLTSDNKMFLGSGKYDVPWIFLSLLYISLLRGTHFKKNLKSLKMCLNRKT